MENYPKKHLIIHIECLINSKDVDKEGEWRIRRGGKRFLRELFETNKFVIFILSRRNMFRTVEWVKEKGIDKYVYNILTTDYNCFKEDRIYFEGNYSRALYRICNSGSSIVYLRC